MHVSKALSPITTDTMQSCLPSGQLKPFPKNQLSLITVTGAKGSLVNHSQIATLLGQQELEGRRVPRMSSGKTLPCFHAFDTASRAGGFVTDRFLTGLRPAEYFYHCMAGREGLVDTAVKTARSGYLQRCLVKNLEALTVAYDESVRDADQSIIQFNYGEDGVDPTKAAYLTVSWASVSDASYMVLLSAYVRSLGKISFIRMQDLDFYWKNFRRMEEKYGGLTNGARSPGEKEHTQWNTGEPHEAGKKKVLKANHNQRIDELIKVRRRCAKMTPGEAVGVIAAQSMGEPSTQMTLNTFHFAGAVVAFKISVLD